MDGQVGVPAHIGVVLAVYRSGHGSKRSPRHVAGPVLIISTKQKRVTEIAVGTVVVRIVVAAAVDWDTAEHVASTVSSPPLISPYNRDRFLLPFLRLKQKKILFIKVSSHFHTFFARIALALVALITTPTNRTFLKA